MRGCAKVGDRPLVEDLGGDEEHESGDRDRDQRHPGKGTDEVGVGLAYHCYSVLVEFPTDNSVVFILR